MKTSRNMTSGSLTLHLLGYAIPMILGNLLQLTYNAADSVIIGKFLGENALAAVSTCGPVMTILVLGASGISLGASVLISRFFGAKQPEQVRREFACTVLFGLLFSLGIFVLGAALTVPMLRWIRTPEAAMPEAVVYLRIVLVGFLFTFQYNVLSACLRGIGNARAPVVFLGVSCALNILLDVLMVAVLPLGVAGAGWATAISQAVSVGLCVWFILRRVPELRPRRGEFRMDRALLRETLQIGSLSALQQAAQPIGKACIQGVINLQGVTAIGAFNAATKLDDYVRIPTHSVGDAIMTATAQNRGAGLHDRERESFRKGLLISLLYFPLSFTAVQLFKVPAVRLLCPDDSADMVAMGVEYLAVKSWIFIIPCFTNSIQGHFRGVGRMRVVLAATVLQTGVRTICVFLWVPQIGIVGEAYACLVGWCFQLAFEYGLYWQEVRRARKEAAV